MRFLARELVAVAACLTLAAFAQNPKPEAGFTIGSPGTRIKPL